MTIFKLVIGLLAAVGVNGAASFGPTNPGMQIALTNAGLNYAREIGVPILLTALKSAAIPDFTENVETPVGHIKFTLSGIHIESDTVASSTIDSSPTGLSLALTGVGIAINGHWHYREDSWPHVSDSGSLDANTHGASISATITFGATKTGQPSLHVASCTSNVGDLSVEFHGGASWLYNLFKGPIADAIKKALQPQLCSLATAEINTVANQALAKLPLNISLGDGVDFDLGLLAAPKDTASYLTTQHKGEFFYMKNSTNAPFATPAISVPATLPRMMYIWITTFLADSAGYAYQLAGVLDFTITNSMIPSTIPIQLNTSCFATVAPGLAKAHPNAGMVLQFNALPAPVNTTTNSSGLNVSLQFGAQFLVILPNGTKTPAFQLHTTTVAAGIVDCAQNVSTKGWSVRFALREVSLELKLQASQYGPVDAASLQELVDFVVQGIVLPQLNKAGAKGIPIPIVDGVQFVKPEIVFGPDWVRVDTDVSYTPTAAAATAAAATATQSNAQQ